MRQVVAARLFQVISGITMKEEREVARSKRRLVRHVMRVADVLVPHRLRQRDHKRVHIEPSLQLHNRFLDRWIHALYRQMLIQLRIARRLTITSFHYSTLAGSSPLSRCATQRL